MSQPTNKGEEVCGYMILTPTPEHNGGAWCAEKKPCKFHDKPLKENERIVKVNGETQEKECKHDFQHTGSEESKRRLCIHCLMPEPKECKVPTTGSASAPKDYFKSIESNNKGGIVAHPTPDSWDTTEAEIRKILGFSKRAGEDCNVIPRHMDDSTMDRILKVVDRHVSSCMEEWVRRIEGLKSVSRPDEFKIFNEVLALLKSDNK